MRMCGGEKEAASLAQKGISLRYGGEMSESVPRYGVWIRRLRCSGKGVVH